MQKAINLFKDPRVTNLYKERQELIQQKAQLEYNLFTLSSYNNQLENFHSDVLSKLLDPEGVHKEGFLPLERFLNYLAQKLKVELDPLNYQNAIVTREVGRLDIWIKDPISKRAIIFENKVNDAPDQENQLDGYYSRCREDELVVDAILYVSLRGLQIAPVPHHNISHLIKNVAFFSDSPEDLVTGWLEPLMQAPVNFDTKSLIYQYNKLIKYMAFESIEKKSMTDFYELANTGGYLEKIDALTDFKESLPLHRAENFIEDIKGNISPFRKIRKFKKDYAHVLLEDFIEGKNKFKIDVIFSKNGNAEFIFWNPGNKNNSKNEALDQKIIGLGYQDKLNIKFIEGVKKYVRMFSVKELGSLVGVDDAILYFTRDFIKTLNNNFQNQPSVR